MSVSTDRRGGRAAGAAHVIRPGICSVTLRQLPVAEVVAITAAAELASIEWGADVHVPPGDDPALVVPEARTLAGLIRVAVP